MVIIKNNSSCIKTFDLKHYQNFSELSKKNCKTLNIKDPHFFLLKFQNNLALIFFAHRELKPIKRKKMKKNCDKNDLHEMVERVPKFPTASKLNSFSENVQTLQQGDLILEKYLNLN
jgi:hypothetical protein